MPATNTVRGEAEIALGDDTFRLSVTMDGLERLSTAIACQSLQELYARLMGTEIAATRAALRIFVIDGTVGGKTVQGPEAGRAAAAAFLLGDMTAAQAAFVTILAAFVRERDSGDEGPQTAGQTSPI